MSSNESTKRRLPPPYKRASGSLGSRLTPIASQQVQSIGKGGISSLSEWTFAGSIAAQLGGADELTRPFEENETLWACATVKAAAVRSVPLRIYASDEAEEDDEVTDPGDPIVRLLQRSPNGYQTMGDILGRHVFNRIEGGEDWWFLADKDGKPVNVDPEKRLIDTPVQLIQLKASEVECEKVDRWGFPALWRYTAANEDAKVEPFPALACLSFLDTDPYNRFRGLGAAQVIMRWLGAQFQTQRYIEGLSRNSGEPGGILTLPRGASKDEIERHEATQDDRIADPTQRGRTLILEEGTTFTPNQLAPKDMEFQTLIEKVVEVCCEVTGVPPPLVGIYKDASYNNIKTAQQILWTGGNGVISLLKSIESVLNERFFPRLRDERLSQYRAYFDLSDIEALREDQTDRVEACSRVSLAMGAPYNDIAPLVGLEPVDAEWADAVPDPYGLNDTTDTTEPDTEPDVADPTEDVEPEDETAPESPDTNTPSGKSAPVASTRAGKGAPLPDRTSRLSYWEAVEKRVGSPSEAVLMKPALKFLRSYVDAQLARLRAYARNGKRLQTADGRAFESDAARLRGEPDFEARVASAIQRAAPDISPELARQAEVLLLNRDEWEAKMRALFGAPLRRVAHLSLADAADELGSLSIGVGSPEVAAALKSQTIQLARDVTGTLAERVRTRLLEGLAQASTPLDLHEALKEVLPELEGSLKEAFANRDARAQVIARTEGGKASNMARNEQFKADGITETQWLTERDSDVRESHRAIDGAIAPIGTPFPNGLTYPQQDGAPAEESINCRCRVAPIFED